MGLLFTHYSASSSTVCRFGDDNPLVRQITNHLCCLARDDLDHTANDGSSFIQERCDLGNFVKDGGGIGCSFVPDGFRTREDVPKVTNLIG